MRQRIKMIVPTIDTELMVLAQHKEPFTKEGIQIIVSSLSFIEQCRDKRKINLFFQQRGIPCRLPSTNKIPGSLYSSNPITEA